MAREMQNFEVSRSASEIEIRKNPTRTRVENYESNFFDSQTLVYVLFKKNIVRVGTENDQKLIFSQLHELHT